MIPCAFIKEFYLSATIVLVFLGQIEQTVTRHVAAAFGDVKLPAMFTDHAVLQRDMPVPVWGWAEPGEKVTVTIAGQTHKTNGR